MKGYRKPTYCDEKAWEHAQNDAQVMSKKHDEEYTARNSRGVLLDPFGEHGTKFEESVRCSISNARHVLGV